MNEANKKYLTIVNKCVDCQSLALDALKAELQKPLDKQHPSTVEWFKLLLSTPIIAPPIE